MRRVGLVGLCFVAGMLGAMVGSDIAGREVPAAVNARVTAVANSGVVYPGGRESNPVIQAVKKVGPATVNIDTLVMRRASIFGFSDPFDEFFGADPFSRLVPSKGQGSIVAEALAQGQERKCQDEADRRAGADEAMR